MLETPVSLLERLCRRPDERHWERFFILFTPMLSRWADRLGVPSSDTEDLLQEVFTLLFRKLPEFRYDPSRSFRAWLWTLFHRRTIAWRKRQTRPLPLTAEQLEEYASPDSIAEASEAEYRRVLLDRIMRIVQSDFPPQTWQIFRLLTVEGKSGVEIAHHFGLTPNAVYLARGRVLARLRQEMTDWDR